MRREEKRREEREDEKCICVEGYRGGENSDVKKDWGWEGGSWKIRVERVNYEGIITHK